MLELNLFGGWEASYDGRPLRVRMLRERALLTYVLVEQGERHSRATLVGLLWPEMEEEAGRNNLRVALSRLRRVLEAGEHQAPVLQSNRHEVWVAADAPVWVDVACFDALVAACDAHRHEARPRCAACQARLAEAVALYRGEFLAGFGLEACPAFDEWLFVRRELWHVQVMGMLGELSRFHEQAERLAQAEAYVRRALALDGLQETAHRQLMRLLARQGQQTQALVHYEKCREILATELGVEPDAETVTLYQQIKENRLEAPAVDVKSSFKSSRLPGATTPFVGREVELSQLGRRLHERAYRLISLVGPGGIGKTRLALEAARENQHRFDDGAYYVRLATVGHVEALAPAILQAMGLTPAPVPVPAREQLLEALRPRRCLLVLDNFEHLVAARDLLLELLTQAPDVVLLVTSREQLNVQAEDLFRLKGLPFPQADETAEASRFAAVKLFCDRAYRLRKSFLLSEENAPAVAEICRLVEGMPLALELAATWVREMSVAELAAGLREGLDLLATDMGDIAPQHQSMQVVLGRSWELLPEEEQALLQQLAFFDGSFTVAAASAMAGATRTQLARLRYRSLLRGAGSGRYDLHALLRRFAGERLLQDESARAAAAAAHSEHYLGLVAGQRAKLYGQKPQQAVANLAQEVPNVRQAWLTAVETGRLALLERALEGLWRFYQLSGQYREGETLTARAAAHAASETGDEKRWQKLRARLLTAVADFQGALSKVAAQRTAAEEAARLAHAVGADGEEAQALLLVALSRITAGENRQALPVLERALARAETAGARELEAAILRQIGNVWRQRGDLDKEASYLEQALALQRASGGRAEEQTLLIWLGINRYRLGKFSAGYAHLREAARLDEVVRDPSRSSKVRYVQALVEAAAGQYALAQSGLLEVIETNAALGDWWQQAYALAHMANVESKQGEHEAAAVHVAQAIEIAGSRSLRETVSDALTIQGHVRLRAGRWPEAEEAFGQALAYWEAMGQAAAAAECRAGLAYAAGSGGSWSKRGHGGKRSCRRSRVTRRARKNRYGPTGHATVHSRRSRTREHRRFLSRRGIG